MQNTLRFLSIKFFGQTLIVQVSMDNKQPNEEHTHYTLQIIESLIDIFDIHHEMKRNRNDNQTQIEPSDHKDIVISENKDETSWQCKTCTFQNKATSKLCELCGNKTENAIKVGSRCEVYSRSNKKWYNGTITDIFIDAKTNELRFGVLYKNNTKRKIIPSNSENLIIINEEQDDSSMNLNILKQQQRGCKGTVKDCECLQRIIFALKYYNKLNIINKESDKDKLVELGMDIYHSLLDDYTHILLKHNQSLEEIFNFMIYSSNMRRCELFGCSAATRHHRDRRKDNQKYANMTASDDEHEYDEHFMFYMDTMDGIHCYLYHLYDVGYRVKKSEIESDIHDEEKEDINDIKGDVFDATFSKINKIVKAKEKELKTLKGFNSNRQKSNKFNLNANIKAVDEEKGIYIYIYILSARICILHCFCFQ